jgi:deazaflavin-dependent oxidoreductase (nitroreductase family)
MLLKTSSSKASSQTAFSRTSQKAPAFMIPLMKMPLILYRLGLGWMLGKRFMRLTHVGRKSGKIYHTVLAVLRFDEQTQEIFAVSPWSGSNWYHNIQAAPALAVETGNIRRGRIRYTPIQRSLTPEEIAELFIAFRQQYPIFSRMVARIPGWKIDASYDEFLVLARTLRGVAFQPGQVNHDPDHR